MKIVFMINFCLGAQCFRHYSSYVENALYFHKINTTQVSLLQAKNADAKVKGN